MGDSNRWTVLVITVLILGSFGIYQESLAAEFVGTFYVPAWYYDLITKNYIKPVESVTKQTVEIRTPVISYKSDTRPTFGIDHADSRGIVDNGFRFNDKTFSITDNYHTPFAKQPIKLGEVNSFEAKVYAEKKLKVQEFLFGIPDKGEAHLAELGIEVWYDLFGEIQDIKVIQNTDVIDVESLMVTHEKSKCLSSGSDGKCDLTKVSVIFLEPLKDSVMGIKAIDYKNRYQITYLNEGFDISGATLHPMATMMYASPAKYEGLIPITQTEKYSNLWVAEDGRMFEKNNSDSFKLINYSFERFQDSGEPRTRLHSGFGGVIMYENERALNVFNATALISELPETFAYDFPETKDKMTKKFKKLMQKQENIALKYLEEMNIQNRE